MPDRLPRGWTRTDSPIKGNRLRIPAWSLAALIATLAGCFAVLHFAPMIKEKVVVAFAHGSRPPTRGGTRAASTSPPQTPRPTATPRPTDVPRPTATPEPTATPRPTASPSPQPSATATPRPTASPTPAATSTPRPTATPRALPIATLRLPSTASPRPVVRTTPPREIVATTETVGGQVVVLEALKGDVRPPTGGSLVAGDPSWRATFVSAVGPEQFVHSDVRRDAAKTYPHAGQEPEPPFTRTVYAEFAPPSDGRAWRPISLTYRTRPPSAGDIVVKGTWSRARATEATEPDSGVRFFAYHDSLVLPPFVDQRMSERDGRLLKEVPHGAKLRLRLAMGPDGPHLLSWTRVLPPCRRREPTTRPLPNEFGIDIPTPPPATLEGPCEP